MIIPSCRICLGRRSSGSLIKSPHRNVFIMKAFWMIKITRNSFSLDRLLSCLKSTIRKLRKPMIQGNNRNISCIKGNFLIIWQHYLRGRTCIWGFNWFILKRFYAIFKSCQKYSLVLYCHGLKLLYDKHIPIIY